MALEGIKGQKSARITVKTAGVWRASQIAEAFAAIDALCSRIAMGALIADALDQYEYVVSNLRALGLWGKESPESWGEAERPTDIITRRDFVDFVRLMRNLGVDVQTTSIGLQFKFSIDDLLPMVSTSARPEVEHIRMSSPGEWSMLLPVVVDRAVELLAKVFDSFRYPSIERKKRELELRKMEAGTEIEEEKAKQEQESTKQRAIETELKRLDLQREHDIILFDHAVAVDSFIATLRNAGFNNAQLVHLRTQVNGNIEALEKLHAKNLIEDISMSPVESEAEDAKASSETDEGAQEE